MSFTTHLVNKYGFLDRCDHKPPVRKHDSNKVDPAWYKNIKEDDRVYVVTSALTDFMNRVYPTINCKFHLITGDSTNPPSKHLQQIPKNVKSWFSQNNDLQHIGVRDLPLGIDYHTIRDRDPFIQEKELLDILAQAPVWADRKNMIFTDTHLSIKNNNDRTDCQKVLKQLPEDSVYFLNGRLDRLDYWKEMVQYKWVASPWGVGRDCHRTWEALALGCVPIVKKSCLTDMLEGVAWQLDEWTDLLNDCPMKDINHLQPNKIDLQYWSDIVFDDQLAFITLTNPGYLKYTVNCLTSIAKAQIPETLKVCKIGKDLKSDHDGMKQFTCHLQENWCDITRMKFAAISNYLKNYRYVVFTDGDIVYLQSDAISYCLQQMIDNPDLDYLGQQEGYYQDEFCTGFMIIRSTPLTRKLFDPKDIPKGKQFNNDQIWFNRKIRKRLKCQYLPLDLYPNGRWFYKHPELANGKAKLVHFNWSVGHEKTYRMKEYGMWLYEEP